MFGTGPAHRIVSLRTTTSNRRASRDPATERKTPVLRDVPGPSALGGGWRRSLDLLYLIAATEFKRTYFGTALGYLWSLARPLLLFAVLVEVFTKVFHLGNVSRTIPVLLLMNIVLFGFFQEATVIAVGSVVAAGVDRPQDPVPAAGDPARRRAHRVFNVVLNLIVVVIFLLAFGVSPTWTWLLFPVVLGAAGRAHRRRVDDRLLAVPALSRHGDHLDRARRRRCSTRRRSCTRSTAVSATRHCVT